MRKKYEKTSREDPRAYYVAYRKNNPIAYLINSARYRSKKHGDDFTLTIDDLEVPELCPIYKIPLKYTPGGRTDNSYSLDRLDNSKGYTKENVRVISWKANQMKGDFTIEEVESLLNYMKGN